GHFDRARADLDRALELLDRGVGPLHPVVASVLNTVGTARWEAGDLDGAAAALRRSIAITEEVIGKDSLRLEYARYNPGEVLRLQGKTAEALAVARRAYDLLVRDEGPESAHAGYGLYSVGAAMAAGGDAAGALPILTHSVAILEAAPHPLKKELAAARFEL